MSGAPMDAAWAWGEDGDVDVTEVTVFVEALVIEPGDPTIWIVEAETGDRVQLQWNELMMALNADAGAAGFRDFEHYKNEGTLVAGPRLHEEPESE